MFFEFVLLYRIVPVAAGHSYLVLYGLDGIRWANCYKQLRKTMEALHR